VIKDERKADGFGRNISSFLAVRAETLTILDEGRDPSFPTSPVWSAAVLRKKPS
jgi:hypothetical protein